MKNNKGRLVTKLLLAILFIILIFMIFVWLFPTKGYFNSLFQDVFRNNIDAMREAGEKYYTAERLPLNVGDSEKITLQEMLDKKMILPFTDKNGKTCNLKKSYVKITKTESEYEMKVYLSCKGEEAYIISYLGCKDYCAGLGKCDETCSSCGKNCSSKILYEYKRKAKVKEITGYTCEKGYTKKDDLCYKKITKDVTKKAKPIYETTTDTKAATPEYKEKTTTVPATPVYEENTETKDATPLYGTKKETISGTPVYGSETINIDAEAHNVETITYKYLYKKDIQKEYSEWSDWSENKEYDPNNNDIAFGPQELIWNEKNGAKKITKTTTIYDKDQPIYETTYDNVIGTYKRYVCSGFNYYIDQTTTKTYQYGAWTVESTDIYTSMPQSNDPNVQYIFKGMDSKCNGDCIETPRFVVEKRVRTYKEAETYTSNNLQVTCNIEEKEIPVYGIRKTFVGYVSDKITEVRYVYYYHTKTRTITKNASTDYKWSYKQNDESLLKNGYSFVREEVASKDTTTYYTCPANYTLNGTKCYKETSKIVGYTCPAGYELEGKNCVKETKYISGYICDADYKLNGTKCYKNTSKIIDYTCEAGFTKDKKECKKKDKYISGYTCDADYTLSGTTCYKKSESKLIGYECEKGFTKDGKECKKKVSTTVVAAPTPIYKSKEVTEYRWSEKDLSGWTKTGNKKTSKVCK